jgi:radical SAM superfamily enzyme YgiQ (UPF0313 family)
MRVLLVNVIDSSNGVESQAPPLGLAYCASFLRREVPGVEVKIVDRNIRECTRQFRPEVVGLSAVTQNFGKAGRLAGYFKECGAVVVVGGHHLSALPHTLPPQMDIGVIGEGEVTFCELIRTIQRNGLEGRSLGDVKGIVYRGDHGRIEVTPPQGLVSDLDKIPFPARDLLSIPHEGVVTMISSRGCPYNCRYCSAASFWGKTRFHSAGYIVDEIEHIMAAYSPKMIYFWDDLFLANARRMRQIADLVCARDINRAVSFGVIGRANLVTGDAVKCLKDMGVAHVCLGLETGSDTVMTYLKGHSINVEAGRVAIKTLKNAGMTVSSSFIIGSPQETESDIRKTYELVRSLHLANFEVFHLTPYPGTPLWAEAMERSLVSEDMDWSKIRMDSWKPDEIINMSERLTTGELIAFGKKFNRLKRYNRMVQQVRNYSAKIPDALSDPRMIFGFVGRKIGRVRARWMRPKDEQFF